MRIQRDIDVDIQKSRSTQKALCNLQKIVLAGSGSPFFTSAFVISGAARRGRQARVPRVAGKVWALRGAPCDGYRGTARLGSLLRARGM